MAKRARSRNAHYVYGTHAVRALLEKRPGAILSAKSLRGSNAGSLPELTRALAGLGVPLERVPRAELDRLAHGGVHQGIIAETRGLEEVGIRELEELVIHRGKAFRGLILDGVQDPRNLGACLRTADAAGADRPLRSSPLRPPESCRLRCSVTWCTRNACSSRIHSIPFTCCRWWS